MGSRCARRHDLRMLDGESCAEAFRLKRAFAASAPGVMPALQRVQLLEVRCQVCAPVVLVDADKHLSICLAHYLEARYCVRPLQCTRAASGSPVELCVGA